MTIRTPSMVSEVSATLVATTTLRGHSGPPRRPVPRRQVAVERKDDKLRSQSLAPLDGAIDFIFPGHKDEGVAFRMLATGVGILPPQGPRRARDRQVCQIFDRDRESAALRRQPNKAADISRPAHIERGRHDQNDEIGPPRLLKLQRAGQRDVAVEMAFVKFVEDDDAETVQLRVSQHLPK